MPVFKKIKKKSNLRKAMKKTKYNSALGVKSSEEVEKQFSKASHERESELKKLNPSHTYLALYHH